MGTEPSTIEAAPPARDALAPGTLVAGYCITRRLGGGGMGAVYAAEEPNIGKRVAIKVLRRELAADDDAVARFEREARVANEVRHPGIVDVFAFGNLDDGRPYLVMSLLEGRHLGEELSARGKLPPAEAWAHGRAIAEALAAAHDRGVVHRDLKPENVFLERFDDGPPRVRVLDLGLVKLLDTAEATEPETQPMKLTKTGVPIGTPLYMAPEQWWGGAVDARVDQYALGVTLYELLAGAPPFRAQQFMELAQAHLHADPPSLAESGCDVAPRVEAFLRRLLAKAPEDRFASMRALVDAGDAAFGAGAATDETVLAPPRSRLPPRKALGVVAALAVLGPLLLFAVGYAGASRHDLPDLVLSTGPPFFFIVGGYLAGLAAIGWAMLRGARGPLSFLLPWGLALGTATAGMLGTHTGWSKVHAGIAKMQAGTRFEIMHMGMLELLLSRFFGFYLAALLLLGIAVSVGSGSPGAAPASSRERRLALALALGFAATAAFAFPLGAPSATLVAIAAGVVAALPLFAPATTAVVERSAAAVLACGFVLIVALARVEARRAALWQEQPTRAARAVEVIAAETEWSRTITIGVVCLAVVAAVELGRVARLRRTMEVGRPGARAVVVGVAVLALVAGDVALRRDFDQARAALHRELDAQFALFSHLDPPGARTLEPGAYPARPAPALQIARTVVAVDASPVVPLSAVRFEEGAANVGRELSRAMATRAVAGNADGRLAVSIDRELPWSTAADLLATSRRAGAENVELLLTRGAGVSLPDDAPPEARWVLASDFVAVPIIFTADGLASEGGTPYAEVAAEIVRRAEGGERPVRIALPGL